MGKLRSLASDTAYYGLSSIVGRAINFLLLPFYTTPEILTEGQFGEVGDIYAKIAFLNIIYLFGLETTYFRFVTGKNIREQTVFNNAQSYIVFISLVLSALLFVFDTEIVNYFELEGREIYLRLAAAIIFVDSLMAIPFAKLRHERKAKQFATFKLVNIGLNVVFNIVLLYVCPKIVAGDWLTFLQEPLSALYNTENKAKYVLYANLMANLCYFIMLRKMLLAYRPEVDWPWLAKMLKYAYPLVLTGLAGVTNEMFSRAVFVKVLPKNFYPGLENTEALGVFVAVYRFAMFMTLAIQAFRYAAEPFFFSQSVTTDSKNTFARVFYYFAIAGSLVILGISLNLDLIKYPLLRNEVYWQGLSVVPILLTANFFLGIYFNFSIWFKLTDKTFFGTYIALMGAVLTVSLNLLLIPLFGYTGSAIVTLIVYVCMVVVTYFIGRRHYPIPYDIGGAAKYLFISLLLLSIGWYVDLGNPVLTQLFKEFLIIAFIVYVYVMERNRLFVKGN